LYDENDVLGWSTTASNNRIELWQSGFNSVPSFDGNQHAEVNASAVGGLFQDILTSPGSEIIWSFAHRGRAGVDTLRVEIGPPGGPLLSQGVFSTGSGAWDVKTGTYEIPAGQTVTRFQFTAVSTAANNATVGNFIDAVQIGPLCDYGDAASSFAVLRSNSGAAHRVQSGAFLGSAIDPEFDGQPSLLANSDDNDGNDDEDGVVFGLGGNGEIIRQTRNVVSVTASTAGYVNVWVDLNRNGVWSGGEQVLADSPVSAGTQSLQFPVPASAIAGTSYARVRYSTDNPAGALGPGGDWGNGEVEDLLVQIVSQAVLQIEKSSQAFVGVPAGLGTGFNVPLDDVLYRLEVENIGEGSVDNNSVFLIDSLPPQITFFNGDANGSGFGSGRVIFLDNGSGLNFDPVSDVRFSNSITPPSKGAKRAAFACLLYQDLLAFDGARAKARCPSIGMPYKGAVREEVMAFV
jgi:hypothetical protein